ncbi:MAG: hypothetical protein CBB71_12775 [Rhodopirellula sp. TMED11]|nr:MAG: hypothetical protein CBB71_12775 [Rhodopirellula sp. TMED11]
MPDSPEPASAERNPATAAKNSSQFVGFQIAGQKYAIPIDQIQEIVIPDQVTLTPQVAACVEGVTNLRGQIIPVVNLRLLLDLETIARDDETRMIVVNVSDRRIGLVVDSVSQVIRIPFENIQPSLDTMTVEGNHDVAGFAKLDDALFILLDMNEMLQPQRLTRPGSAPVSSV